MLSALILLGYMWIQTQFMPKKPAQNQQAQEQAKEDGEKKKENDKDKEEKQAEKPVEPPEKPLLKPARQEDTSQQWPTLGSLDKDSPFRFAVTFNSRGGTIERIELNERTKSGRFRYRDSEDDHGYMGSFAPRTVSGEQGVLINALVDGTPAQRAGLKKGDVLVKIGKTDIKSVEDYSDAMLSTEPGDSIPVQVRRGDNIKKFDVQLTNRPLSIVGPDPEKEYDIDNLDPLSMRLSIGTIGDDQKFVPLVPEMLTDHWQVNVIESKEHPTVEFRFRLASKSDAEETETDETEEEINDAEVKGGLEVVKRYRLVPTPKNERTNQDSTFKSYHLEFEIEVVNHGDETQKLAYQLMGPTGLPTEGWWFVNKIHPNKIIGSAGVRDVIWRSADSGMDLWSAADVFSNTMDAKEAEAEGDRKKTSKYYGKNRLFTPDDENEDRTLRYLGGDTQYFSVVLLPAGEDSSYVFHSGKDRLADPSKATESREDYKRKANVTFEVVSREFSVAPNESKPFRQEFHLFAGPKVPDLLAEYDVKELTEYGWYGFISKPLTGILHFFYGIVRNYGIAIIMLTILVRACMMPISRKAARNAQMMQLLQPEMKKIAEKYKNDMQKRGEAQRALFAKYNYNPFGGCLLMFLQLPIFLGLYRGLSVDIVLRDQPLIPGLGWCSNLAAPDQLFYWADKVPIGFLTSETGGWLGPYFNILPLITVALFLVQQKLFTPPAQDEQARMTQRMMTFMTLFIGLMFFKVPSGLCIYFITSSLWGVAERKLLPKPKLSERVTSLAEKEGGKKDLAPKPTKTVKSKTSDNGAARKERAKQRRKKQQKKRR